MPKHQASSLAIATLTASALANASQLCPVPAVQTLLRLAALALDVSSVRKRLFLPTLAHIPSNEIPRTLKLHMIVCNTLRVTPPRSL